jgi:hypothetical protein
VPSLAPLLAEKEAAILADLGGAEQVSAVRHELVVRFLQSSAIAESLGANIAAHGVLTTKGKTRAALRLFLEVLDRQIKLAGAIGLGRQTKPVRSLEQAMREWGSRPADAGESRP